MFYMRLYMSAIKRVLQSLLNSLVHFIRKSYMVWNMTERKNAVTAFYLKF